MEIKIYTFDKVRKGNWFEHNIVPTFRGTIELDVAEFNESEAQKCWDICNWSCWADEKPKELNADIDWCDHGIVFKANEDNYLALSNGWLKGNSVDIATYVEEHKEEMVWII